jgi:hypothetical protein
MSSVFGVTVPAPRLTVLPAPELVKTSAVVELMEPMFQACTIELAA